MMTSFKRKKRVFNKLVQTIVFTKILFYSAPIRPNEAHSTGINYHTSFFNPIYLIGSYIASEIRFSLLKQDFIFCE